MPSDAGTIILQDDGSETLTEDGSLLVSDGDSDCDCCGGGGSDKSCYARWEWDCPTQTKSVVEKRCATSDDMAGLFGAGWTWNGTKWQIWGAPADGTCDNDGDCTTDGPGILGGPQFTEGYDDHPCPDWWYPRVCDPDTGTPVSVDFSFAMLGSEIIAAGLNDDSIWRYGDTCYSFNSGSTSHTFSEPAVVIHPSDVTPRPSCAECADTPPLGCQDYPCILFTIYDENDVQQDQFLVSNQPTASGCDYYLAPTYTDLVFHWTGSQWEVLSSVGGYFQAPDGDATTLPSDGTWAQSGTGWYAVMEKLTECTN